MSISSYTNVQRVIDSYPAIGSASTINSATIFEGIQAVSDEIDQALAKRYTLPLSAPVPALQTIATRMTLFDLLTIRGMAQWSGDQKDANPFYGRLKDARRMLEDIRDGESVLVSSSGMVIAERTDIAGAWSNTMGTLQTMHEGEFTDMVQDSDKIDSLLNARDL
jgi:phage gp36-like protein